jgi:transposase-like protein
MPTAPPLIGSYAAPAVRRGEVVTCLYRDCDCLVTVMSDAPIPWPRVQPRGKQGGSGLWVNDELCRAIRTESAEALKYHFGVSASVVWKWRKQFGVGGRATTAGSKLAILGAAEKGAVAVKEKEWTAKERRARSRLSKQLGLKPTGRWKGKEWTEEQLALLGTDHDEAIAKKLGRTRTAVTAQRVLRKIPAFSGWPGGMRGWTDEEVALLGTMFGSTRRAV